VSLKSSLGSKLELTPLAIIHSTSPIPFQTYYDQNRPIKDRNPRSITHLKEKVVQLVEKFGLGEPDVIRSVSFPALLSPKFTHFPHSLPLFSLSSSPGSIRLPQSQSSSSPRLPHSRPHPVSTPCPVSISQTRPKLIYSNPCSDPKL
jgi:hypothetical protein